MCCREINAELKDLKRSLHNLLFSDYRVIENQIEHLQQINLLLRRQNNLLRLRHRAISSQKDKVLGFESKFLTQH